MPYNDIANSATGNQSGTFQNYSVPSMITDSGTTNETIWNNTKASSYLGYYKTIPELKIAIDAKARWAIGKGFIASELTTLILSTIKGFGKDCFNIILENMIKEYNIYGDAFAEIIRNDGQLINLKPLDPSKVWIIANSKGIIKRYDYMMANGKVKEIDPENMFHLARGRIADEIHGISIIDACEGIILARNEAMADYKKLLHRNVYPVRIWHLDTDNATKIANFKAKVANSKYLGEDIFIPKDAVTTELATVPAGSTLNPLPWIALLNEYFYQAVGVPQIIIGGSQEFNQTAAQIAYLAFEQTIEEEQLYIEEQVLYQLNLEINLEFPASLQNNMISDEKKDGTVEQQLNQPSNIAPNQGMNGGKI
jgi:hypothetical protein